jgi:predicted phage terminase large subunit-like protein
VNPEGGKISRAAAASPRLESGNWYLPHPQLAPWVDGFINECAAFPGSVNDDQVDAWSQRAKRLMTVIGKRPAQAAQRHESERSWML